MSMRSELTLNRGSEFALRALKFDPESLTQLTDDSEELVVLANCQICGASVLVNSDVEHLGLVKPTAEVHFMFHVRNKDV